ncbi:MAG: sugar nucleotide-binding protein, partial [Bacillota bacterium]
MKVFITGSSGQLGSALCRRFAEQKIQYTGVSKEDFDLADIQSVFSAITKNAPTFVIHCAAFTQVGLAEKDPQQTFLVNGIGTRNIVMACKEFDIPLIYISTDYVFDGKKKGIYYPEDNTAPLSVYGKSKEQGEREVLTHL